MPGGWRKVLTGRESVRMRRAVGCGERARLHFQPVEAIPAFDDLDEGIQGNLGELLGPVSGRPVDFQFFDRSARPRPMVWRSGLAPKVPPLLTYL